LALGHQTDAQVLTEETEVRGQVCVLMKPSLWTFSGSGSE